MRKNTEALRLSAQANTRHSTPDTRLDTRHADTTLRTLPDTRHTQIKLQPRTEFCNILHKTVFRYFEVGFHYHVVN